ncbi:MAG: hypothetical protein ACKVQW_05355, partial [Pyrinomonadaceae bacterium]
MAGKVYEERVYKANGELAGRNLTSWSGANTGATTNGSLSPYINSYAKAERTTSILVEGGNALAQSQTLIYSNDNYLNVISSTGYDFVPIDLVSGSSATIGSIPLGTPLKTTETTYVTDSNYVNEQMVSMPKEVVVKNGDQTGPVIAKTETIYDNLTGTTQYPFSSPIMNYGIGTSLNCASTGTINCWEDPNTVYRGLPTTTRVWNPDASGQWIESHVQYDQFGNAIKTRDPIGNETTTAFDPLFKYAYPTSVTTPAPDPSGVHGSNTGFTTSTVYDFNTGLPTSATDVNGQTSTMEYNDPLLRPTKVIAPNGQQTITEYGTGTTASTRFVKVRSQIDETNWKESYTWYDGLGRTIRTQSVDDDGDVFALTCYDNMGRVSKVTNPFRGYTSQDCSTTTGLEWTSNTFDTAGRPWKVTTPDSAVVETQYLLATTGSQIGTVVTVTDQAGKQRRSITNALGQLVRVDEPDATGNLGSVSAPNQPTSYAYDTLNNLTTVTQGVQTRTFAYNSLSRLTSATNPESGTINYGYDPNGNLTSKTDARGVKTDYIYDALNRVTNRNYSLTGSTPPNYQATPNVTYFYDGANVSGGIPNSKGRLTKVTSSVSTTEYVTFDILGRVTRSKQITDGVTYGDDANPMTYSYNLAGALVEQKYPSGRVVKNVFEANGDLSMVQSKKTPNSGFFNYAKHFTYAASGAVTSMQLGNGRWESTAFNSRLQPTQIALGTVQNATDKLKLDYSYGDWNGTSIDATKNNGNIVQQIITVPTVGSYAGFTATQKYYYDSLNRIDDSTETIGTTQTWRQDFTYDRYGNRRFNESNTTMPASFANPAITNPTISTTNNRINAGGYSFDNSGNTTTNANSQTFIYDAENKQIQASNTSGIIGQYWYDGDGRRIKKYVPSTGETTIFVYDAAGQTVAEYSTIVASSQ